MKTDNKLIGTGLLTAIAASLCCITPVLALIAGTSGLASTFSWLEPFDHILSVNNFSAWFCLVSKVETAKKIDCKCETTEKSNFMQTKSFLGIITVMAALLLSFPIYAHIFFPKTESKQLLPKLPKFRKLSLQLKE
jgi:formate hydrogenlyase subunit 3/multisubunit Na+/H+ antiporter MnhD subunit